MYIRIAHRGLSPQSSKPIIEQYLVLCCVKQPKLGLPPTSFNRFHLFIFGMVPLPSKMASEAHTPPEAIGLDLPVWLLTAINVSL